MQFEGLLPCDHFESPLQRPQGLFCQLCCLMNQYDMQGLRARSS